MGTTIEKAAWEIKVDSLGENLAESLSGLKQVVEEDTAAIVSEWELFEKKAEEEVSGKYSGDEKQDAIAKSRKTAQGKRNKALREMFQTYFEPWLQKNEARYYAWVGEVCRIVCENCLPVLSEEQAHDTVSKANAARIDAVSDLIESLYRGTYNPFFPGDSGLSHYIKHALAFNTKIHYIEQEGGVEKDKTTTDRSDDLTEYFVEMTAMILNFQEHYSRHFNREAKAQAFGRLPFYRLWFTEITQQIVGGRAYFRNVADVENALRFDYLDFYMENLLGIPVTKSLRWLVGSRYRSHYVLEGKEYPIRVHLIRNVVSEKREVSSSALSAEERRMKADPEIDFREGKLGWLYADVPLAFLKTATGAEYTNERITNTRRRYLEELGAVFYQENLTLTDIAADIQKRAAEGKNQND